MRKRKRKRKSISGLSLYQVLLIDRLAARYSGEELDRKLEELRFCSLKTAKKALEQIHQQDEENNGGNEK